VVLAREVKQVNAAKHARICARAVALCVTTFCTLQGPLVGQELRGRVLEAGSETGVAAALVRLIDAEGEVEGLAVSDSSGIYRLSTPGPGDYRLTVEAYGYAPLRSHLLAVGERDSYAVSLELAPTPVPITGLRVSADRFEELEDGLRLVIGVHPRSLRYEPILRPQIEDHIDKAHGLTELVRWSNAASIVTRESRDGPCFQWRNRHCMPVYLNGAELTPEVIPVLPLDMIDMIVIMTPGESAAYASGAVLLYTPGWIG
jgi:hypothetical protein